MNKSQQNSGFSDVDYSINPQSFIDCLDEQYAINGKLIIADPDHDSLIIDTPFAEYNNQMPTYYQTRYTICKHKLSQ